MTPVVVEPETEALPMDKPPAAALRRPNHVVERKLGELDACLADALSSRTRRSDVDVSFFAEIQARIDFLRTLIAAEGECHGGTRPEILVEAEARFAFLESVFEKWARSGVVAATTEEEEPETEAAASGSACSCTDSCFGFEFTGQEVTCEARCNAEREAAETHKAAAVDVAAATTTTTRRTTPRRWWRRGAALCGAAGVVTAAALGVGLALEFAAVAHQTVYLVPT